MRTLRTCALILVLVLGILFTPTVAQAQGTVGTGVSLIYWGGTTTARNPGGQFGSWPSNFFGLEINRVKTSGWGFGAQFVQSGQGRGTGSWASLERGTDSIFQAWVSRRISPPTSMVNLSVWGGFGKYRWDSTFLGGFREVFRNKGPMIGAAIYAPIGRNLDVGARVSYTIGSTTLESGGVTSTSSGNILDWNVNLTWDVTPTISLQAGYRALDAQAGNLPGCPSCNFNVDGGFLNLIVRR